MEASTGLVRRMRAWRWRRASGGHGKETCGLHREFAAAPAHPFYQRLNELLEVEGFDEFAEGWCAKFYAAKYRRPGLMPGTYFRLLLICYFEGIDSERLLLAELGLHTQQPPAL